MPYFLYDKLLIFQELASKTAELEAQAAKTAQELAEYKAESKELRNQDLTVRRLEDTVRALEAEIAEKDNEVNAARLEAAAELQARSADEARAREERLEAELQRAEAALEAMRRMHQATQAQLFSVHEKGEEAAAAARAEAELAAEEVERAQERLALLARERDALLEKVGQGEGGTGDGRDDPEAIVGSLGGPVALEAAAVAALREELRAQRDLVSRLQRELSSVTRNAESELAGAFAKVSGLQASLQATEAHAAALEAELVGRPTLQELEEARQQVRVLNAVVHNTVGEDYEGTAGSGGPGGAEAKLNGGKESWRAVGTLESALLAKNRHLEHKLTMARLDVAEAQGAAETAAARVTELEGDLERHRVLIARLEEDLLAAERAVEMAVETSGSGAPGATGEERQGSVSRGASNSGLSTAISGEIGSPNEGAPTLINVLSAQRDRLRARVHELESAAEAAGHALAKAKQDVAAARADNVALVEQLRYVQGYGTGGAGSGSRSGADIEAGSQVVGRYMKDYEDRVNPLNDFRSREREARRKALPLQDRAAMALGSALVSGSRVAKSAIVVYALALHLIAFLVLAGFSHRHADKMDALEEMCAQLQPAGGLVNIEGTDPVIGGAVAAVVKETVQGAAHALRRRLS